MVSLLIRYETLIESGFSDLIELNGSHYQNESSSLLGAEKREEWVAWQRSF